jgi:hypothetical protein
MMVKAAELMQYYESGVLTRLELLLRLCQAAAGQQPAQLVADIPSDVLTELREKCATPPATPDKCRVYSSVCAGPGFDAENHFREESRRLFDGLWRWHGYFAEAKQRAAADGGGM